MLWINTLILLSCLKIRKHLSLVLEGTGRMFPTHIDQLQNLNQGQLWTIHFPPYSYVKNQFSIWCCLEMRPLGQTLRVRSVCSPSIFLPLFFPLYLSVSILFSFLPSSLFVMLCEYTTWWHLPINVKANPLQKTILSILWFWISYCSEQIFTDLFI